MKFNIKIALAVLLCVAMSWPATGLAQEEGESQDEGDLPAKRHWNDDFLADRLLKNLDEAPVDLREGVNALQDAQELIRSAWVSGYKPGPGASPKDLKAAREAFQADYAEEIAASKQLRSALAEELRAGVRQAIDDSNWNEDTRALYAEYKQTQARLGKAWRAVRSDLGQDVSRKKLAAAKRRFNQSNADLIARQKELATRVRGLVREKRENRSIEREALPREFQDLRREMSNLRNQLRERQRRARNEMRGMSREEREQYREELLNDLRELHDEIKERRRQTIDGIRDDKNGDRHPGS